MAGKAVRIAAEKGVGLDQLSINDYRDLITDDMKSRHEWKAIGPFDADVKDVFDPIKSVEARNAIGGTSPQSVKEQIKKANTYLRGD
jgi:argininosuccinate lyase